MEPSAQRRGKASPPTHPVTQLTFLEQGSRSSTNQRVPGHQEDGHSDTSAVATPHSRRAVWVVWANHGGSRALLSVGAPLGWGVGYVPQAAGPTIATTRHPSAEEQGPVESLP
jgi:hypothetical protein